MASTMQYIPDGSKYLVDLCDAVLVVKGERFPVNSGILACHSRFFGKMIVDLQNDPNSKEQGKLTIPLDETMTVEDVVLMLSFVYGKQTELETAEEAYRMLGLADKYDIPILMRASATKMKGLAPALYFLKPKNAGGGHDAARWLTVADRLEGMEDLRTECLYCILRDLMGGNGTHGDLWNEDPMARLSYVESSTWGASWQGSGWESEAPQWSSGLQPSAPQRHAQVPTRLREAIKALGTNGVPANAIGEIAAALAIHCKGSSYNCSKQYWCNLLQAVGGTKR